MVRWVQSLSGASAATLWLVALSLALHPELPPSFMGDGMTSDRAYPLFEPWASDIMCAWGPFETDVNLTVTGTTDVFPAGGPVELVGRVTNQARRLIYADRGPQWYNWQVRAVYEGDAVELPYRPSYLVGRYFFYRRMTSVRVAEKGMGESWDDPLDLGRWFDLERPGKYRVVVARIFVYEEDPVGGRGHWVRSNVLEFEIRAGAAAAPEWPR